MSELKLYRTFTLWGLVFCLSFVFAIQARAETTLHFNCTLPTTCTNGATTLITSNNLPTFTITTQSNSGLANGATGELYMVALVPNSAPSLSFSVNGSLASAVLGTFSSGALLTFLNVTPMSTSDPNFDAYFSAFQQATSQGGVTATGLTVYVVDLGSITALAGGFANGDVLATVSDGGITGISGFPSGSVLYAILTNGPSTNISGQTAVNTSPLSESVTTVADAEPASAILLAISLLVLGGASRRYWRREF